MAQNVRNTVVYAGVEAVSGTPETLTDTDAVLINEGTTFVANPEEVVNPALVASLDRAPSDVVTALATVTIPTALKGSGAAGTAPGGLGTLFRGCRFAESIVASTSVTYTPTSGAEETLTLEVFEDGIKWISAGCVGTFSIDCVVKEFFIGNFTFTGIFISKSDVAVPAATFDATTAVAWRNGVATADGSTVVLENFSIDPGNTIANFSDPNTVSGHANSTVSERDIRGSMTIQETLLATRDFFNDNLLAGTTMPLVMTTGATPGNITTINVPAARLLGEAPEDNQGVRYNNYAFQGTTPNGGMTIVFT